MVRIASFNRCRSSGIVGTHEDDIVARLNRRAGHPQIPVSVLLLNVVQRRHRSCTVASSLPLRTMPMTPVLPSSDRATICTSSLL